MTVVSAVNGREAIDGSQHAATPFDLVLMDVQMPELDGLEATVAIRAARARVRRRARPIVAMTAHAMKGDRERCLAAGMDDYLSKPIRPADLVTAVERIAARGPSREPSASDPLAPAAPAAADNGSIFDPKQALARLGGDRQLLRQLIRIFRTDARPLMAAIKRTAADGEADGLRAERARVERIARHDWRATGRRNRPSPRAAGAGRRPHARVPAASTRSTGSCASSTG